MLEPSAGLPAMPVRHSAVFSRHCWALSTAEMCTVSASKYNSRNMKLLEVLTY